MLAMVFELFHAVGRGGFGNARRFHGITALANETGTAPNRDALRVEGAKNRGAARSRVARRHSRASSPPLVWFNESSSRVRALVAFPVQDSRDQDPALSRCGNRSNTYPPENFEGWGRHRFGRGPLSAFERAWRHRSGFGRGAGSLLRRCLSSCVQPDPIKIGPSRGAKRHLVTMPYVFFLPAVAFGRAL